MLEWLKNRLQKRIKCSYNSEFNIILIQTLNMYVHVYFPSGTDVHVFMEHQENAACREKEEFSTLCEPNVYFSRLRATLLNRGVRTSAVIQGSNISLYTIIIFGILTVISGSLLATTCSFPGPRNSKASCCCCCCYLKPKIFLIFSEISK